MRLPHKPKSIDAHNAHISSIHREFPASGEGVGVTKSLGAYRIENAVRLVIAHP